MKRRFEDLPWHDATILELKVDRRRPGEADEVMLSMLWPDGQRSNVLFVDCYALVAAMNFGVVAAETVRVATEFGDTEDLRQHQVRWSRLGVDLSDLRMFRLETNSTASAITVFARGWKEWDDSNMTAQ
jgi:hypothetical protein